MFIALNLCLFTLPLTIPVAVVLSQCIGIGGCGWPNSSRVSRIIFALMAFRKSAPSSASATLAVTHFNGNPCGVG